MIIVCDGVVNDLFCEPGFRFALPFDERFGDGSFSA
jgi:hypothetical protein